MATHLNNQSTYWDRFSTYPLDAAVVDPNDRLGHKNSYICSLRDRAIFEALQPIRGATVVLDFGCGTGGLLNAVAPTGINVVGVDISLGLLKRCRDRSTGRSLRVLQIDGQKLPFRNETFDIVCSYIVLMYSADDQLRHLLSEFWRILRPGGRIVLVEQLRRRTTLIAAQGKIHRDIATFSGIVNDNRFKTESVTVLRSGHFPLTYLIRFGLVPRRLWKCIGTVERIVGHLLGILPLDYSDVRLIARKLTK